MPLVGRTAMRGQELQSRLLCAGLVGDLIRIAFLVSRRWAPYDKWLETVFPLAALPPVGSVEQWVDSVDVLTGVRLRAAAAGVYRPFPG